jgi:hypothetical protein
MTYPSFAIATLALLVAPLYAQELRTPKPATPPSVVQPYTLDSGSIDNPGAESVVYSKQITFGMTAWLQFRFGELTNLPQGSFLRMTSRKDQDWQVHNAGSLGTWGQNSAGFNGGSVLLELVAGANTKGNRVDLDRVTRGLFGHAATQETPCNSDDRVQTGNSDKRQGRLWMGCTGWLYGICDGSTDLMMSAGHCSTGGTKIMEFDVPNSTAGGTVVRAAVNDQYPYTEEASSNAGVGNDWMVCKVGANSNTGKTPTQWNGGLYYNVGAVPASTRGQNIRITGYGVFPATGSRNSLSQTQQTNVGTLHSIAAASLGHRADSSGGNSGGPVIHENTGDVIGIHTHGGCSTSGSTSSNKGTRVDLAALVAARNAISCSHGGCLSTTMAGGNGLTAANSGNMFNMKVANAAGINVTSMGVRSRLATGTFDIEVYITPGGYNGKDANAAAWTLASKGSATSAGSTVPTDVDVDDFFLPQGGWGMYVLYLNGGIHYTNGNTTNQVVGNADLSLSLGIAKTAKFGGSTFNPRVWNGKICYSTDDVASRGHYGWGCGGATFGIPQWEWDGPPAIGAQIRATLTGMNTAGGPVFWWIGMINAGGVDVSALGMPGCALFVSPIVMTVGMSQSGGTLTGFGYNMGSNSSIVGVQLSNQIGVIDPTANSLGVALSDAVAFRVGN